MARLPPLTLAKEEMEAGEEGPSPTTPHGLEAGKEIGTGWGIRPNTLTTPGLRESSTFPPRSKPLAVLWLLAGQAFRAEGVWDPDASKRNPVGRLCTVL